MRAHMGAMFATLGVIATVAIIAGAFFASTYLPSSVDTITTQNVSSQSFTSTYTSSSISVSTVSTHGWINSSAGFGSYPPVTFGADDSRNISPIGPSVELGTTNYTTIGVPANTFVAESFPIPASTVFSMVLISFSVPENGPDVTMAAYINGSLLVQDTRSLNLGIGPNVTVATMISEATYFFLNQTYAVSAGSVVTIAFLANGPVSIFPMEGITGSSSMVSDVSSIPST